MKHHKAYIDRQNPEYFHTHIPLECAADIVVVIPCYNEPGLLETIRNLCGCHRVNANVVTLIVLNSSVLSDENVEKQNRLTYNEICQFVGKQEGKLEVSQTVKHYGNQNVDQNLHQNLDQSENRSENQSVYHVINQTVQQLKQHHGPGFNFFPLLFEDLPRKHAGVGLARKIGMDLAVEHFLHNKKSRGVIVSLDADCTVSPHFFTAIWEAFSNDKSLNATIHDFHHRVEEGEGLKESSSWWGNRTLTVTSEVKSGILKESGSQSSDGALAEKPGEERGILIENTVRQYEAYIHYFRKMLRYTGFPYYYHTVGSAFAVSADAYVRVGGMGRQQGGEDFYFLQKIFALGHIRELKDACVFPMARLSDRVPFGTGPSLQRIMDDPDGNKRAYSEESFHVLKQLFDKVDAFYGEEDHSVEEMMADLHPSLLQFLEEVDFLGIIRDCNENSASLVTFRKRFFHHFNAFRIIKYLNRVHPDPFSYRSYASLLDKW